jgi:uncharacterized cupredoxin-like copper-binding protein
MKRLIAFSATTLLALAAFAYSPSLLPPASAHGEAAHGDAHGAAHGGAHGGHAGAPSAHAFEAGEQGDARKPFRTIEIVMKEGDGTMAFVPDRLEARKGEQIKFVIRNEGQLEHELLIDSFANTAKHKAEMEKNSEMAHEEPNGTRLKPGGRTELIWRFSKTGTFEIACLIPGHYETGMKGVVVVR